MREVSYPVFTAAGVWQIWFPALAVLLGGAGVLWLIGRWLGPFRQGRVARTARLVGALAFAGLLALAAWAIIDGWRHHGDHGEWGQDSPDP